MVTVRDVSLINGLGDNSTFWVPLDRCPDSVFRKETSTHFFLESLLPFLPPSSFSVYEVYGSWTDLSGGGVVGPVS